MYFVLDWLTMNVCTDENGEKLSWTEYEGAINWAKENLEDYEIINNNKV